MPSINFAIYPRGKAGGDINDPRKLSGELAIECQVTGMHPAHAIERWTAKAKEELRVIMRDNPRITTFD